MGRQILPSYDVHARRVARGVELYGTAELPDHTNLRYEVGVEDADGVSIGHRMGTVVVADGAYSVLFEPSPWSGPRLDVSVSLRADRSQPPATQKLLGDHGQRMIADVGGPGYAEFFFAATVDIEAGAT